MSFDIKDLYAEVQELLGGVESGNFGVVRVVCVRRVMFRLVQNGSWRFMKVLYGRGEDMVVFQGDVFMRGQSVIFSSGATRGLMMPIFEGLRYDTYC